MRRQVGARLGAVAAIVLGASAPARADGPVADPQPPTSREAEDLLSWLGANIASTGWRIADLSRDEALFIQPRPSATARAGIIRTLFRWESFSPPTAEHPWRSALQLLEVACAGPWFRELSWTAYSGSNFMADLVAKDETADEPWRLAEAGSIVRSAIDLSCGPAVQQPPATAK